jgi:hypothetical protein
MASRSCHEVLKEMGIKNDPPGPAQNVGIIGDRAVAVHVFNPPPEGGTSNTVHQLVLPR